MIVVAGNAIINMDYIIGIYIENKPNTLNCTINFNCTDNRNYTLKCSDERTAQKVANVILEAYKNKEEVCYCEVL